MSLRAFTNTVFERLPIGACFTDPDFDGRRLARGRPGSIGDFTASFARNGLFIKIHSEFAYRDGRKGLEEAVIRYEPAAEVIYGNSADFNGDRTPDDDLKMTLLRKVMELGPAGTPTPLLLEAFRSTDLIELRSAIIRLTTKPKPQYQPKLARLDGLHVRLTSDGVRLALNEGYPYAPSQVLV